MEANKVPEKVYRTTTYLSNKGGQTVWKKQPVTGAENIEYTRTDAFIEKAVEYLSYHLDTSKIDVNYKYDFIEDFRKYMKGE